MKIQLTAVLMLLAALCAAETLENPFARSAAPAPLNLGLGRLEWGPTTLGYSQAWAGGESYSQGYLLKDLRAALGSGFEFDARFGLSFSPGNSLAAQGDQPELVIPFAALSWQPSDKLLFRLEYSRLGGGLYPGYDAWGRSDWRLDSDARTGDPADDSRP